MNILKEEDLKEIKNDGGKPRYYIEPFIPEREDFIATNIHRFNAHQ